MNRRYRRILKEVMADAHPASYLDIAMMPVGGEREEFLALYRATASAQAFVKKRQEIEARRGRQRA
jgi:hypothetical protein